jgi:TolB protein
VDLVVPSPMRSLFPIVLPALAAFLLAPSLGAQDSLVFHIRATYRPGTEPGFVVLPFVSGGGGDGARVRDIIRRDVDYSDRFRVRDGAAPVRPGEPAGTVLAQDTAADWVLTGEVTPRAGGLSLRVALYDLRLLHVKEDRTFSLPRPQDRGFRMAVHAVSDEVLRWVDGTPGFAASRIAFVRGGRGTKEIYLVDSDGENLERVTSDGSIALSPAWSPDGRRLAYTSFREGTPVLYERDLGAGTDRVVSEGEGLNITPAYAPDGQTLAFAALRGGSTDLVAVRRGGSAPEPLLRGGRGDALSPTWSPDGRRVAFVSNRLGEPHVYVASVGGEARLLSEYRYGQGGYNTSPDWSPKGSEIAYHTRVGGSHQIAVVDAAGGKPRIVTGGGWNEDPSWAPDGRHLVFAASGAEAGLYVADTVSGRIRPLVRGHADGLPDWSPVLARALSAAPGR